MKFDGVKKNWIYMLEGRRKAPFAPVNRVFTSIPNMEGAHLTKTETGLITIDQPVGFEVQDDVDALVKKDELAEWLVKTSWTSLEFDDEPVRIYQAVVNNTIDDFDKFVNQRQGTIHFICKPYAEGNEVNRTIDGTAFNYVGTAHTYPVITCTFSASATSFTVTNQDGLQVKVNYNFQANDVLELNFETQKITINGVVQMPALAWSVSDWFAIKPGSNTITASHTAEMTYKERWK